MGLTKRCNSYYVEFRVLTSGDGKSYRLASEVHGARLKRWKVGCLNKQVAREMEAAIRMNLLLGKVLTKEARPVLFSEWATTYLDLEEVKALRSYRDRSDRVSKQLVPYFGGAILGEIRP